MSLINFRKNFDSFPSIFARIWMFEHFRGDWAYAEQNFFGELSKKMFLKIFTLVLSVGFLDSFSNFRLFWVKIYSLIWYFWVIFENYSMPTAEHTWKRIYRTVSIRGNDFIAHWAYAELIFAYAQPAEKCFYSFYMYIYAEHTGKWFYRTLSIRGNDLNDGWAYAEIISLLTEHMGKCLKVEYLGRIKYDFQKSLVTGPWDHKDLVSAK